MTTMDVAALAELLHETAEHHGSFEAVAEARLVGLVRGVHGRSGARPPRTPPPRPPAATWPRSSTSSIDWLLDGDPAIRWQVLRDLTDASPDEVAAERARVEHEGWGARLLALEDADGLWDGGACFPACYTGGEPGQPWTATMHTLQTLQLLGLDPASESARRRSRSSPSTGAGSTPGSGTSTARSSRASTAGRSRPAPTSGSTSRRSSSGSSASGSPTAAGTARPRTDRCAPRSTRRSTCSTGCSSSSARPAGRRG